MELYTYHTKGENMAHLENILASQLGHMKHDLSSQKTSLNGNYITRE